MRDFERGVTKRGYRDIETIGSYLALHDITPDLMVSSCALYAQITADKLAQKLSYHGAIYYMKELYRSELEVMLNVLSLQDESDETIFLIGDNPALTEFANYLTQENFAKFPTMGVLAVELPIERWSEIKQGCGKVDFFIYPKQFKYYMPKQIRTTLSASVGI